MADGVEVNNGATKKAGEPLLFFSQSKSPFDILSNFYEVDIEMPEGTFPSVEHYFQATKFIPEDMERFAKGKEFDQCAQGKGKKTVAKGRFAKSAGSKSGSAKYNLTLVSDAFDQRKAKTRMKAALREKFKIEPYKRVLLETETRQLVHIGMRGNVDYWTGKRDKISGEIVGENTMGKLLMEVRSEISGSFGEEGKQEKCKSGASA